MATQIACQSNLRTVVSAAIEFSGDNGGLIVGGDRWIKPFDDHWWNVLRPYVGKERVTPPPNSSMPGADPTAMPVESWRCPADRTRGGDLDYGAAPYGYRRGDPYYFLLRSYNLSRHLVSGKQGDYIPVMGAEVENPEQTIYFTDFPWYKIWSNWVLGFYLHQYTFPDQMTWLRPLAQMDWHGGKVSVAFVDGHIGVLEAVSLFPGEENESLWYARKEHLPPWLQ
jgi:prepilin-type processing-associated H-X9-DG protein